MYSVQLDRFVHIVIIGIIYSIGILASVYNTHNACVIIRIGIIYTILSMIREKVIINKYRELLEEENEDNN